jgi:NTP pyrophosphatase (non-canonical NTP hydrolase)
MTPEITARIAGVLSEIEEERYSQLLKWGEQFHHPHWWLAILTEETGEVAKEVADARIQPFNRAAYRAELIQVAAVAVAAIEALDCQPEPFKEQVFPRTVFEAPRVDPTDEFMSRLASP